MTLTTHEALLGLLAELQLPVSLADHAVWGLALVPGGSGRSKLGGRPELADPWPLNNGRGLTHLASIALEELPDVPARSLLPERGTLVFFADFSEENEGWGPADGSHPAVQLTYIPAGADAIVAVAPEEPRGTYDVPVVLDERRIRFEPVLTMPYLDDIADSHEDAYEQFTEQVELPDHLLFGEPVYIQDDPREPGEVSLLQINWGRTSGTCTATAARSASTAPRRTFGWAAGSGSRLPLTRRSATASPHSTSTRATADHRSHLLPGPKQERRIARAGRSQRRASIPRRSPGLEAGLRVRGRALRVHGDSTSDRDAPRRRVAPPS